MKIGDMLYSQFSNEYYPATQADVDFFTKWSPSSYGNNKRHWFVSKGGSHGLPMETYQKSDGKTIWFLTFESAQKVADRLNSN